MILRGRGEAVKTTERPVGSQLAMRVAARAIGGSAAAVWLLALLASLLYDGATSFNLEGATLGVMVLVAAAGVGAGFRDEERGGLISAAGGLGLIVFALATAGHNHLLAAAVSGGPFLAAGLLFVLLAHKERSNVR
jgi:hypothetical protein